MAMAAWNLRTRHVRTTAHSLFGDNGGSELSSCLGPWSCAGTATSQVTGGKDDGGKPRPAVILQDDRFDMTDSITVCAFTTDPTDAPLFRLPIEPSRRNGLRTVCRSSFSYRSRAKSSSLRKPRNMRVFTDSRSEPKKLMRGLTEKRTPEGISVG
jgi:hypothetical protein